MNSTGESFTDDLEFSNFYYLIVTITNILNLFSVVLLNSFYFIIKIFQNFILDRTLIFELFTPLLLLSRDHYKVYFFFIFSETDAFRPLLEGSDDSDVDDDEDGYSDDSSENDSDSDSSSSDEDISIPYKEHIIDDYNKSCKFASYLYD